MISRHRLLAKLTAATVLASAAACGGSAQFVLKRPVLDKCEAAGLSGCPDIADGVVLYVDGNEEEGTTKLLTGAAQNSPAQVKEFALAIRQLEKIPGAEDYVGPLLKIAQFLTKTYPVEGQDSTTDSPETEAPDSDDSTAATVPEQPTGDAPRRKARQSSGSTPRGGPSDLPRYVTADTDPTRIETGMTAPETSTTRFSCGDLVLGGTGYCVKSVEGPFVITDISALQGCPDELFVAVRDEGTLAVPWILDLSSNVHGARLLVPERRNLIVGARAAAGAPLHQSMACRVTWSGFRPYANSSTPTGP